MRNVSSKARRIAQVLSGDPGSENRSASSKPIPEDGEQRPQVQSTGPEVHINNPDWLELLGSATLPVKSFTPESINDRYGRMLAVYFVDLARLTTVQRGGILYAFQARTGRLTSDLWQEMSDHGLPIPAVDCTPIVA